MKKLIPALAMLLVSLLMSSTATYAWFSMNTIVNVTGLQITAESNDTYLLISDTNTTAAAIQTENAISIAWTLSAADSKVQPSAPTLSNTEIGYLTTSGKTVNGDAITVAGIQVTTPATADAVTNWYTAKAVDATTATINTTTARQLTSFTGYVIKRTVYLTVAVGADNANNLEVAGAFTQITGGTDITAAKVIVTTSDGGFAILDSSHTTADIKGSNTALTPTTVLTVNIYVYYDGNETVVYTNNSANLTGAEIDLTFTVDPV